MAELKSGKELALEMLKEKTAMKKEVCKITNEIFTHFKTVLKEIEHDYADELKKAGVKLRMDYQEKGEFDASLTFGGDILYFTQHSNIFSFEQTHPIHKKPYIQEDDNRSFFGMIQIHNFLFDSIRYSREMDIGYLIGRIFINKDRHFFVEGKRQLGFLYNDVETLQINDVFIRAIIESAMIYSIDFDLLVPPFDEVNMITVHQKKALSANAAFKTGKRVGFRFLSEQEGIS